MIKPSLHLTSSVTIYIINKAGQSTKTFDQKVSEVSLSCRHFSTFDKAT